MGGQPPARRRSHRRVRTVRRAALYTRPLPYAVGYSRVRFAPAPVSRGNNKRRALARRTLTQHAAQRHAVRLVLGAAACADACAELPFQRRMLVGAGAAATARRANLSSCRGCMDAADPASSFSRAFRQHAALMPEGWAAPPADECDV